MTNALTANMTEAQRAAFAADYEGRKKSTGIGYLTWLVGLHYAYVGKWGLLVIYWLTMGGIGMWMIADAFRMPGIIGGANQEIARDAARTAALF